MSGTTFGLPISELEARNMAAGFSSSALMFPYNPPRGARGAVNPNPKHCSALLTPTPILRLGLGKHRAMNGGRGEWPIGKATQLRQNDSSVLQFSHDDVYNGRLWEAAATQGASQTVPNP